MKCELLVFLDRVSSRLTSDQIQHVKECFVHGEEGLGLEDLCVGLCEAESLLEGEEARFLHDLCKKYGVTDDYLNLAVRYKKN
jgi:hypothetical protein